MYLKVPIYLLRMFWIISVSFHGIWVLCPATTNTLQHIFEYHVTTCDSGGDGAGTLSVPGGSFPKLLAFVLIPLDLNLFKTYTLYF